MVLVILASIGGATAQLFFKLGSASTIGTLINKVTSQSLITTILTVFTDPILKNGLYTFIGLSLYGTVALLLILALRKGELSIIYPLFAANYVWVALISAFYFDEHIQILEWAGIAAIVVGISCIGYGGTIAGEDSLATIERLGIPEDYDGN